MPIAMFLLKYWKYAVLLLLILGIFLYWKSLTSEIAKLRAESVQCQVDLKLASTNFDTCMDSNKNFEVLVAEQNKEIQKQVELNKKMASSYDALLKRFQKAKADNQALQLRISQIDWNVLSCDDQVAACYNVLASTP